MAAWNRCCRPHVPGVPEMRVEDFKRDIRELNLWSSSCMVAFEGPEPVAVLHAAKRETETWVRFVGVHPEHLRRGHGHHLLTSLSAKLAILGPPRLVADVPEDHAALCALFEACGYRREGLYADFEASAAEDGRFDQSLPRGAALIPVTVDDLLANGLLDPGFPVAWERSPRTLVNRKDALEGIAVASPERIEAWLLIRRIPDGREVAGLRDSSPDPRAPSLRLLLGETRRNAHGGSLRIPKVSCDEIAWGPLASIGFRELRRYVGYTTEARPA